MSSGDFAAELRQSVQDHIALVHTAAAAAKARIGQAVPAAEAAVPPVPIFDDLPVRRDTPRPTVNFFAEEPVFDQVAPPEDPAFESAIGAPPEPLPDGAISFDGDFASVDDEGIPVWEDAP